MQNNKDVGTVNERRKRLRFDLTDRRNTVASVEQWLEDSEKVFAEDAQLSYNIGKAASHATNLRKQLQFILYKIKS